MSASMVHESALNFALDSFESMLETSHGSTHVDLADFLPSPDHPDYRAILVELVRVDLEYGWGSGSPTSIGTAR